MPRISLLDLNPIGAIIGKLPCLLMYLELQIVKVFFEQEKGLASGNFLKFLRAISSCEGMPISSNQNSVLQMVISFPWLFCCFKQGDSVVVLLSYASHLQQSV